MGVGVGWGSRVNQFIKHSYFDYVNVVYCWEYYVLITFTLYTTYLVFLELIMACVQTYKFYWKCSLFSVIPESRLKMDEWHIQDSLGGGQPWWEGPFSYWYNLELLDQMIIRGLLTFSYIMLLKISATLHPLIASLGPTAPTNLPLVGLWVKLNRTEGGALRREEGIQSRWGDMS